MYNVKVLVFNSEKIIKSTCYSIYLRVRHNTMTRPSAIIRISVITTIFYLVSCGQNNKLSDDLKKGLLAFDVNHSAITEQLADTVPRTDKNLGLLWGGLNEINAKKNQDTLLVDVNIDLSTPLKYDGGFEVIRDTLFLYAKQLDKTDNKELVHSTLTYKILSKGLTYSEIAFKEAN